MKFFTEKSELYKLLAKKIYENNVVGFLMEKWNLQEPGE